MVSCWLSFIAIVMATTASADDAEPHNGGNQSVTEPAPDGGLASDPSQNPAESTPDEISDGQALIPWPWGESDPGHDKCKKRKAWALPLWCYGLSSWPVLKAQPVTANVVGIRDRGASRAAQRHR